MACETLMKLFLILFNAIFTLIGGATLGIGVWVKVDKKHLLDLTKNVSGASLNNTDIPSLLENAVIVLIAAGGSIFLIGFLGCVGSCTNQSKIGKLFLKIYAAIVLVLFILEVAGVTVCFFFFDKIEAKLKEFLSKSLETRYNGNFSQNAEGAFVYSSGGDAITLAWDVVQLQFGCCGMNNGTDFDSSSLYWESSRTIDLSDGTSTYLSVPPTCCETTGGSTVLVADLKKLSAATFSLEDGSCPLQSADQHTLGCYEKIKDMIKNNSVLIIAIGASTVFIQFVCIIFACCLAKDKNKVEPMHK